MSHRSARFAAAGLAAGLAATTLLCDPRPAAAAVGDEALGICVHLTTPHVLDAVRDLGVTWVRIDANWDIVESAEGRRDWGPIDGTIDAAHARGLRVFATVGYGPAWASTGDRRGDGHTNDVPRVEPYRAFMAEAARHLRARGVTHIGLWNEPNLEGFFEGSPQEYLDVVAGPGIEAIRGACADCTVLGPEAANVGAVDQWLETVLRARGRDFDIISHHIYQGFEGCGLFQGDCFENALERRRNVFTRISLKELMDSLGIGGKEVWISETGSRGHVGNAGSLNGQSLHVLSVVGVQLERPWYTNTFFYEIVDCVPYLPECDIDGFGFVRAQHTNDPVWPADFVKKPVFDALRALIHRTPSLRAGGGPDPTPEPTPEPTVVASPTARPERPEAAALRTRATRIDGDLDEWREPFTPLATYEHTDVAGGGAARDLTAAFALRWDDDALYLAVRVADDAHRNDHVAQMMWAADSVQAAFDMALDGGQAYDGRNDYELGWARAQGRAVSYVWAGPVADARHDFAVRIVGGGANYEARLPWHLLGVGAGGAGRFGFSVLVNDDDGQGREGWLEWTPGIGRIKMPASFGIVMLSRDAANEPGPGPTPTPIDTPTPPASPTRTPTDAPSAPPATPGGTPAPSDDPGGPGLDPVPGPGGGAPVAGSGGCAQSDGGAAALAALGLGLLRALSARRREEGRGRGRGRGRDRGRGRSRQRRATHRPPPQSASSSSVRGQSSCSSRDNARSASRRPPVWQRAQ
jgi:hypothetical protein